MLIREELIQKIDPLELAQELLGVEVVGEKIRCINPDHEDVKPSMVPEGGHHPHLHCWSCVGKNRWDIFDIAALHLERECKPNSFKDSISFLAEKIGIDYASESKTKTKIERFIDQCFDETREMLEGKKHKQILAWLNKRGITDYATISQIGIAPNLGRKRPFGSDVAKWYVPMQKEGAIVFPLRNSLGEIVNCKFRLAALSPKGEVEKQIMMLNSNDSFFGNHQAKRPIILEGELDALHAMQIFGVHNVISVGGANSRMYELSRCSFESAIHIPDNDPVHPETGEVVGHNVSHNLVQAGGFINVCMLPRKYKDLELFIADDNDVVEYLRKNTLPYGAFLARWRVQAIEYMDVTPGRKYEETTWKKAQDLKTVIDKSAFITEMSSLTGLSEGEVKEKLRPTKASMERQLAMQVENIRGSDMSSAEKYDLIAMSIFQHLSMHGIWLKDGPNLYLVWEGELLPVGSSERYALFQSILHEMARILPVTTEGKSVISCIKLEGLRVADEINYRGNTYTDRQKNILYVGINEGEVLKIQSGNISRCQNGDMGNFISWPNNYKGFEFSQGGDKIAALKFIKEEIMDYIPARPELRPLIAGYMIAAYFKDYIKNQRGILHITGNQGAGKTSSISSFGLLFFGDDLNRGAVTEASLVSAAAVEPAMILDNWEHQNLDDGKIQFLLTSTTGASKMKRKANTERDVTYEHPDAMLVITSIETWGSPELKGRMLSIEVDERYKKDETFLVANRRDLIMANRDRVMSGLFRFFAEDVIPRFANGDWKSNIDEWTALGRKNDIAKHRVLPIVGLASMVVSSACDVYPEFSANPKFLVKKWSEYIINQDNVDRRESNVFVEYLDSLNLVPKDKTMLNYSQTDNSWEGTIAQFLNAFQQIDKINNNRDGFPYRTSMSLARRASFASDDIRKAGYIFEKVGERSTNGTAIWRAVVPVATIEYIDPEKLI